MRDRLTNELVAVKFIERGDKVWGDVCFALLSHTQKAASASLQRHMAARKLFSTCI